MKQTSNPMLVTSNYELLKQEIKQLYGWKRVG